MKGRTLDFFQFEATRKNLKDNQIAPALLDPSYIYIENS